MNNSLNKGLQKGGVIIPLDYHSEGITDYPVINAISYELRSPVTIIKSNIELLKKFCNYPDISLVNETFSFCEDSTESILGFIEKINFLCTSDNSSVKLKPEWFSLRLLIHQIFAELGQQHLDIARIQFSSSVADYKIFLDKCLFIRILVNLLSNALKFSKREVELFISRSGNELSIAVHDYGIGIPENQISEIFNPFVRGTNVKKVKGSGLGLSVVTNAVKWFNGNITLHSEVGKGTEFRIIFPYHDDIADFIHPSQKNKFPGHFEFRKSEYNKIIGTISHELRNPIAILKSNIQLLKKLTFDLEEKLKDERISGCEASLDDMEHFFNKIPLLNIAFKSGINVHQPGSGYTKLYVN